MNTTEHHISIFRWAINTWPTQTLTYQVQKDSSSEYN